MQATRTIYSSGSPSQFKAGFGDFPDIAITRARHIPIRSSTGCAIEPSSRHSTGSTAGIRTDYEIVRHTGGQSGDSTLLSRCGITGKHAARLSCGTSSGGVAEDDSVEIAYFGIWPTDFGRGFGKHLLSSVWARCATPGPSGPQRVWLPYRHARSRQRFAEFTSARGFTPERQKRTELDPPRELHIQLSPQAQVHHRPDRADSRS